MKPQRWYRAESGTRWVKNPEPVMPERVARVVSSKFIEPLLKGEAEGDGVLAILLAIRNLLRDQNAWTSAARAVNRAGQPTDPASNDAVRWDIFGALDHVTEGVYARSDKTALLSRIRTCIPAGDDDRERLFRWQIAQPHSKVLWLLNMSVARRKKELGYL